MGATFGQGQRRRQPVLTIGNARQQRLLPVIAPQTGHQTVDRPRQLHQPVIDHRPGNVGLGVKRLQRFHLLDHAVQRAGDHRPVTGSGGFAFCREAQPGDGGEPFFQLAVKAVGAVADEKLQQAHNERSRQPQQRRGESRAHAVKLAFQT